jgi:integrase
LHAGTIVADVNQVGITRNIHNVCLTLEQPKKIRRWQHSLRISDRIASRNAKNRQARHVPLNEEAVNTLHRRREQSGPGIHIFDVATGFRSGWEKLLRRAGIREPWTSAL